MEFEWDIAKEKENIKKHGIDFDTASDVFRDPNRIERHDEDSSEEEDRWQTIGYYNNMFYVVYTERGDVTRIISARVANSAERRRYHGNSEAFGWRRAHP
ncbi:MAG: BrnT family toxin [Spirochaetota bacterium]|jgi:uncharacterized DUF497 family protein|nr:BrnT family toxin [Spirochaetota bacterium]